MGKIKEFNVSNTNNQMYMALFEQSFIQRDAQSSWNQYKVNIGDMLQELDTRDFLTVSYEEIEKFANEKEVRDYSYTKEGLEDKEWKQAEKAKKNCRSHIRSLMIFLVKNDINNAVEIVSKETLIGLI